MMQKAIADLFSVDISEIPCNTRGTASNFLSLLTFTNDGQVQETKEIFFYVEEDFNDGLAHLIKAAEKVRANEVAFPIQD